MLLLRTDRLADDPSRYQYEIKWDGFRAIALKTGGLIHLRSRNDKDFNGKYPAIVKALAGMPDETVLDGEVVALDERGLPSFNALQNFVPGKTPVLYYVFDVMVLAGADLMRRNADRAPPAPSEGPGEVAGPSSRVVRTGCQPADPDRVRQIPWSRRFGGEASRQPVRTGQRSGAWQKMRVNQGQEFVIAGYTSSPKNFDAIIFGYYDGPKLIYAARTRNGFTPASREKLFKAFKGLEVKDARLRTCQRPRAAGGGRA